MKKILTLAICLMIFQANFAQAPGTITTVEGVFGGRINAIVGGKTGTTLLSDTFRVFVATESANSIFYTYGHFPTIGTSSIDSFIALPSANASVGLGSAISKMAFHKSSQTLYFIANGNIYATTVAAASATKLTTTNNYIDIIIEGNDFYALTSNGSDNTVYYSTINSLGVLTAVSNTTVSSQSYTSLVDGKDDKLYLFRSSTDPQALQFGGSFSAGINFAATTTDAMASLSATNTWNCMAVYTDGTVFVGGTNGGTNPYKYVANSATFNPATYTTVATGVVGTSGSNIEFREDGFFSNYYVYFGSAYSNAKGAVSTWNIFGNAGLETHSNDGAVKFFNNNIANQGTLLLTTDAGLGITKNSGSVISDVNKGILATQVEDFDMNTSKTFGWLAAKDGIRYVNNYNTAAKAWTTAFWPMGDGSPYYSAEMVGNDTNSVYVGNVRIYKTSDKGTTWNRMFTPENAPYSFPQIGVRAEAIAVSDSLNNIVMAGYYNQNAGQLGGVFYSMNSGASWTQLLINASSFGQDVNVNDIEMTTDSGKVVAYIGVEYINSTVRGMYKAQWDGTAWSVRREDIYGAATSLFSVTDIIIPSKDTIAAVGSFYNSVLGHSYPIYFNISRPVMNNWRSTVVDTTRQGSYTACAWNKDTIFYAYQNNIYYDIISFHATSTSRVGEALYSKVDNGTEINVMYYDELLVGSSTGFRSMRGATKIYEAPPAASVTISTANTIVCSGNSVSFNAVGSNAGFSPVYQWKKNGVNMGAGNSISFQPNTINNGDTIVCAMQISQEMTIKSNAIVMTVKQSPTINKITNYKTGAIVSNLTMCNLNDSIQLTNITANGGWNSSNNSVANILILPNTNNKLVTVKAKAAGVATITYNIVSSNGCNAATSAIITVAPIVSPTTITGATSMCKGTTTTLNTSTSGGVWTSLKNVVSINANTGVATATNPGNASIKYTVTNASGCSSFAAYTLTVNSIPNVPGIQYATGTSDPQYGAPNGGFCVGKTFTVIGSPANGAWSATGSLSVTSAGLVSINTTGAGNLTYTYTSPFGCVNSRTVSGVGYNCAAHRATNSIEPSTINSDFKMYPNPAKTFVTIDCKGAKQLIITDYFGRTIQLLNNPTEHQTINTQHFTSGFYLVTLINDNNKQTQKLVIE